MDLGILIGLAVGLASIVVSVKIDGGHLAALLNLSAFLIIMGGTLGATIVSSSLAQVLRLPALVRKALFGGIHLDSRAIIDTLVEFAQKARKEGILALQEEVGRPGVDPFLVKGLQLVVDGADEETVKDILQTEINATRERHATGIEIFATMGGYSPTMGILGAILGLVHVLGQMGESTDNLGAGIAVAFIASLYGVGVANLVFLPLSSNLKLKSHEEIFLREVMVEGVLAIQAGQNPHMLEQKLRSFFPARTRRGE
jgi:chemotaxis protein MotA